MSFASEVKNELAHINANLYRFDFVEETVEHIQKIVNDFKSGKKPDDGSFRRGHYYRGVL